MNSTHARIYQDFVELRPTVKNNPVAQQQLSQKYGLSENTIRHIVYEQGVLNKLLSSLPKPERAEAPTVIADDPYPEEIEDDTHKISIALNELRKLHRHARVMIVSDEHFTDADPRAISMNAIISKWFDPDLLVMNGDTFDLPTISHFDTDRRLGKRDAIAPLRDPYLRYVNSLVATYKVIIDGNHNARIEAFLNANWQFADTIESAYAELVRAGGQVLWLSGKQEIDVGGLFIHHGTRVGESAAKLALEKDFGGSNCLHQGHSHGIAVYVKSVKVPGSSRYRIVTSVSAGFAGNKPAAYQTRTTDQSKWIQSCTIYNVNMNGDDVHSNVIMYHDKPDGGLVAFCGIQKFEVDRTGVQVN